MCRPNVVTRVVALFALFSFGAPAVFAFDLPKPKKPKTSDTPDSSNPPPANNPPATQQPAQQPPPQNTQDANTPAPAASPAAAPASVYEMKLPKSMWDKFGKDLKAGDWVETEAQVTPDMKTKSRQEVLEVGDHYTVVSNKTIVMGTTQEGKIKSIYSEADPPASDVEKQRKDEQIETKEFDDKVKIGDKVVACTRYEAYKAGKLTSKSWISKEVPLGGIVKIEDQDGKVLTQATGFGHGK